MGQAGPGGQQQPHMARDCGTNASAMLALSCHLTSGASWEHCAHTSERKFTTCGQPIPKAPP
eukprot:7831634-Alexandrium_andersonii.AAC.1